MISGRLPSRTHVWRTPRSRLTVERLRDFDESLIRIFEVASSKALAKAVKIGGGDVWQECVTVVHIAEPLPTATGSRASRLSVTLSVFA